MASLAAAVPLEAILQMVRASVSAALNPFQPAAPPQRDPAPAPPLPPPADAAPVLEASTPQPDAAAPKPEGTVAAARTAAARVGATSISKPSRQGAARPPAAVAGTAPAPWSGSGGCVPGGCAHATDAITGAGHPLVLPTPLAALAGARGLPVAPPTGPAFAGRRPGVAPLPG